MILDSVNFISIIIPPNEAEVNCEFPQKCTPLFLIEVDVKGFSILPFERLRAKWGD